MAEMPPIVVQLTVDADEIVRRLRAPVANLVLEALVERDKELSAELNAALARVSEAMITRVRAMVDRGQL